jgi:hypothetical protein
VSAWGTRPGILYEYQNKGVARLAIGKSLILKSAILVVWTGKRPKWRLQKKKSGSKLPHSICSFIQNQVSQRIRKLKEKLKVLHTSIECGLAKSGNA